MKIDNETFFVSLAQTLSLSRTAQNFGLSTASASKQLKLMENMYGVALAIRNTRSIRLTKEGDELLSSCHTILEARANFVEKINDTNEKCNGVISMTVPTVFASTELIPVISAFRLQYPEVNFSVTTDYKNTDIIGQPFDIAIRLGHLEDSSLITRKLTDVSLYLCASPSYLKHDDSIKGLEEFARAKFIILEGFGLTKKILSQYFSGIEFQDDSFVLSTNDPKVQLNAVTAGLGITILPDYLAKPYFDNGELIHLMPNFKLNTLPLSLLYPGNKQLPARVRKFSDFIFDLYREQEQ